MKHVDVRHSPYAAALRILMELKQEPGLWRAGDGDLAGPLELIHVV